MVFLKVGILTQFAVVVAIVIGAAYFYFRRRYRHWDTRNIQHTNPKFPFGDFQGVGTRRSMPSITADLYKNHPDPKILGYWAFAKPFLLVRDPEIIKNILVKDFSHFHDRGIEFDTSADPLINHLFIMKGQQWRNLRIKLTPTFTSGKMKMMFPTMVSVGNHLENVLMQETGTKGAVVEVKQYFARYTTDVIGTCAFGLEVNSLENPDSEFRLIGKQLITPGYWQIFVMALVFTMPKLIKIFKLKIIPKHITDFFMTAVKETIRTREEKNIHRNDFMQLLIELKNKGYVEDADTPKSEQQQQQQEQQQQQDPTQKFTVELAAAQAFIFFFAGFETSSSTMQFALYELALQPEIQTRLQQEIDQSLAESDGELTYENLQGMEYLDKVISETLRKYPVAPILMRQCTKDYHMPDTDVVFKEGDAISIPISGLHYDPKYYPNPEKFDPERFSPEEKQKRDHYVYIPFGEGPRICIGNRFALQQIKVGLVKVLTHFVIEVCAETPIPIELDPKLDMLTVKGGMYLNLKKRHLQQTS